MATQGIEEVTENAIRAVARDCGSLSMECSDVSGYVKGVAERIGEHLKMLDQLEEVTTRLLGDQARVSAIPPTRRGCCRSRPRPSSSRAARRSKARSTASRA